MARISTPGIWLPGPLNTLNSTSPTGQADPVAGTPYYMGMNPGKMIVVNAGEAQAAAAPGTTLYDGAYQVVQLDSGATAANALLGAPAFILLDSGGASEGANPETAYSVPVVTTGDIANSLGLLNFFCGVFINPATVNGQANGPTPGNYTVIFVGGGRANCKFGSTVTGGLGGAVFPDSTHIVFTDTAALPTTSTPFGQAASVPTAGQLGLAYFKDIIFRFVD